MLVSKEDITNYIPQRPPIVMIDNIVSCNTTQIETDFEVKSDNIFLTDGMLSESGLLENIAQSGAAKVGYECHLRKVEVPLGFIGGISKVEVISHPEIGNIIQTKIKVEREVFGVTMITGSCYLDNKTLISCEMKIVIAS